MNEQDERSKAIAGLRAFADWCEAHPEFPTEKIGCNLLWNQTNAEKFREACKVLGSGEKSAYGDWFSFTRTWGPISVEVFTPRAEVCEKIVTKKIRPAVTVPAQPEKTYPESVEEVIEWRCPESIFDADRRKEAEVSA